MRVNGPAISRFDLADATGLFWQAIILVLMVIALIVLVD
jgi:uncharacterized protein involved in exopolysaccharide biosynthesis